MQFFNFQDTFTSIKSRLQEIEWKQTYVNAGLAMANWAVVPFNKLLKSLIIIQGIDPNTEPGLKQRMLFQQAVNESFDKLDTKSYDDDFDFSWLNKKFEEARNSNGQFPFDLTKNDFRELTNIGNLQEVAQPFDISHLEPIDLMTPEGRQRYRGHLPLERVKNTSGVPLAIDQSPIDELAQLLDVQPVNQIAPEPVEQERQKVIEKGIEALLAVEKREEDFLIDTAPIKDALNKLADMAKHLENTPPILEPEDYQEPGLEEVKELIGRTSQLRYIKKTLEQYGEKLSKRLVNPKIRRTKAGNVKAVKISKKSINKTLRGTKEIAQERDEKGRFKGSFKRHDYNKPRGS